MLNDFLTSDVGYNAFCNFLVVGLEYELDKNSPLRKLAKKDILSDTNFVFGRKENIPIYDNPNLDCYYIDENSKKCCKFESEINPKRMLIELFEIATYLEWETTNIDFVFTNLYSSLLEQETAVIEELCSKLDDVNKYHIIMPIKLQLTSVSDTKYSVSVFQWIGLGAIKK